MLRRLKATHDYPYLDMIGLFFCFFQHFPAVIFLGIIRPILINAGEKTVFAMKNRGISSFSDFSPISPPILPLYRDWLL